MLGGKRTEFRVAHTKLSHSRAFIVRAYPPQTFRVLGGVSRRGIFHNMKTAGDRIGSGEARQVNARFEALACRYLFEPEFFNPASGWDEGAGQEERPGCTLPAVAAAAEVQA